MLLPRVVVWLLAGALLHLSAAAPAQADALVVPKTSLLRPVAKIQPREPRSFTGQDRISGTLVARWSGTGSAYSEPDYFLVPDATSIRNLPHFEGYDIRSINVANGQAALVMAVGTQRASSLLDRRVEQISVSGFFVVRDYEVSVECDAPWAMARIVSVKSPHAFAANIRSVDGC